MADDKTIAVKVAVRARPLNNRELEEGYRQCLQFRLQDNQVNINGRQFSFDFVFDPSSSQESIYDSCAFPLIEKLFEGYNCTMFAYGQTGSGKTYTMGTEENTKTANSFARGIIPRMVEDIFRKVEELSEAYDITVTCSMLEIYEERVLDLLSENSGEKIDLAIREHPTFGIFVQNLSQNGVSNFTDTLNCLEQGCLIRTKGQTAMNAKSSRSHAIFTLFMQKTSKTDPSDCCRAKLNMVDLAGSERLKKTQAEGERKREGIKINEGLLALGNVISALTDTIQQRSHIPYRDSKLTRLLQDSLGGNSHTVMIACVSPADGNYDETLNTLRYAERAKKIKNKPTVNLDATAVEIFQLRKELQEAQLQLLQYQSDCGQLASSGSSFREVQELKRKNEELSEENMKLSSQVTQLVVEQASLLEKIATTECQRDEFKSKIERLLNKLDDNVTQLETSCVSLDGEDRQKHIIFLKNVQEELCGLQNTNADECSTEDIENDCNKSNDGDDEEFDEDNFRRRQGATSQQLNHLLRQIKEKEELIQGAAANHDQMEKLKASHQKEMVDLTEKIEALQNERRELESKLQSVQNKSKVSESRRKRLQELEKQLSEYKRKIADLQKMEKMKQQSDQSVKKLKEEVVALKQMRVQLVRQLRDDNQRFRQWQLKTEKQMNQMKVKEKRREFEAERAKRKFDQQLTVHRRKYEEAVAFTKRLQTQLQRQGSIRNEKFNEIQESDRLVKDVKNFLEHEIDAVVSIEQAKMFCENLIQQRKDLTKQLNKLQRKLTKDKTEPAVKRKNLGDGQFSNSENNDDNGQNVEEEIASLNKEISLRNVEIQELQKRVGSFDADAGEDKRWNAVHTLMHAKCALKVLFNLATASRIENLQTENQLYDAKCNIDLAADTLKKKESELEELKQLFSNESRELQDKLVAMERQQNNKVSCLLKRLFRMAADGCLDEGMKHIMEMHCEEAEKMQLLTEQLEQEHEEKIQLTKELSKAKVRERTTKSSGQFFTKVVNKKRISEEDEDEAENRNRTLKRVIYQSRTRLIRSPIRLGRSVSLEESKDSVEEEYSDLDDQADSDYRETPLHKRTVKVTNQISAADRRNTFNVVMTCSCRRSDCSTLLCGCAKRKGKCIEDCSCSVDLCKNRVVKAEATENDADKTFNVVFETPPVDPTQKPPIQLPIPFVGTTPGLSPVENSGLSAFARHKATGKLFKPITPASRNTTTTDSQSIN